MREAGEPEVPRAPLEQPAREPDRVDDGSGDTAAREPDDGVVEKGHVEARVVGDEHRVTGEREEAPHGQVLPRRASDVAGPMPVRAVIAAGSGCPGSTSVSNVSVQASSSTRCAPISTMREPRGERPVVSRSKTTNAADSRGSAAPGASARPTEAPRHWRRASPKTTSSRSERAIAVGADERAKSSRAASVALTGPCRACDELDEAVGGVERELHPLHPDTNMCSCPVGKRPANAKRAPAGALWRSVPEELPS